MCTQWPIYKDSRRKLRVTLYDIKNGWKVLETSRLSTRKTRRLYMGVRSSTITRPVWGRNVKISTKCHSRCCFVLFSPLHYFHKVIFVLKTSALTMFVYWFQNIPSLGKQFSPPTDELVFCTKMYCCMFFSLVDSYYAVKKNQRTFARWRNDQILLALAGLISAP